MENENTGITQQGTAEKPASVTTAELSQHSPSSDKNSTKNVRQNVSDEDRNEAASTIAGAMLICKDFGIKVDYANVDGSLYLVVHGVQAVTLPNGKLAFQYVGDKQNVV